MTKEELYDRIGTNTSYNQDLLDEFFERNIVIPKGENRHPYADVLHEWLEGDTPVEYVNRISGNWEHLTRDACPHTFNKLRIKPKEPVYEWQWYDVEYVLDFYGLSTKRVSMLNNGEYMTEFEADGCTCYGLIYRFEETKQERK